MTTTINKKKKAGRPTKAVRKEIRACVRLTRTDHFVIKEKAAKAGMTTAAYLREAAIHCPIVARLTEEEREWIRKLIGMDNNLNQTAKACHQEGALRAVAYFEQYRGRFDELLKKLRL
jgi:hypothetical protein